MHRILSLFLLSMIFTACETTSYQYRFGPRETAFGDTVHAPFNEMITNAKQEQLLIARVYFDYDKDLLTENSMNVLQESVFDLKQRKGPIVIEGHADHFNTEKFNEELGYKRALKVADYLKSAGVWDERIVIKSFGEDRPIASNWNDDRKINRRVDIRMYAQGYGLSGKEAQRALKKTLSDPPPKTQPTIGIVPLSGSSSSKPEE